MCADNVVLNSGSGGATLATDEDAGTSAHYQWVKLVFGGDNTFTKVASGDPLPVTDTGAVSITGSALAHLLDIKNAVEGDVSITGGVTVNGVPAVSLTGSALAHLLDIKNAVEGDLSVTGGVTASGPVAAGAAVSGNPVGISGEARTTLPTAVDDGDAVRPMLDDMGRVVTIAAPRDLVKSNYHAATDASAHTLITASTGAFFDLTLLTLSNSSGSNVTAYLIEESATGSATTTNPKMAFELAASGGGAVVAVHTPIAMGATGRYWFIKLSSAVSTVHVTAQAIKTK